MPIKILHSCWYVCKSRCFLVISTWKLVDQGLYSKCLSKFAFDALNQKILGSIPTRRSVGLRDLTILRGSRLRSHFCFWVNKVILLSRCNFICQLAWLDFCIIPVNFVVSPVENLLLGLTPEMFWKFDFFPRSVEGFQRAPDWDRVYY